MTEKQVARENESSARVFLRIKHPSINPIDITDALDMEPEHCVQAGLDVAGSGVRRLHTESYWLAEWPLQSGEEFLRRVQSTELMSSLNEVPRSEKLSLELLKVYKGVASMFEIGLIGLLRKLRERREFLTQLTEEGGRVTLLIERSAMKEPLILSPTVLSLLTEMSITIEID